MAKLTVNHRFLQTLDDYRKDYEGDDEVMIFQIIADILEFCDKRNPRLAFDDIVAQAREHLRAYS